MNLQSRTSSIPPRAAVRNSVLFLTGATAALLTSHSVRAAVEGSWNVDADGNWATAADPPWLGGVVPGSSFNSFDADTATFGFPLSADRTVTVDAWRSIFTINFSNPSANKFTLAGQMLMLTSEGVIKTLAGNGVHTDTISSAIEIQSDAGYATFTADASFAASLLRLGAVSGVSTAGFSTTVTLNGSNRGANTVAGVISDGTRGGQVAVTKGGTGTWVLAGANTYTGVTTLSGGTLQANHGSALGNGGAITFDGGTLAFSAASASQNWAARIKNSLGAITVDTNAQTVTFADAIDSSNAAGLTKLGEGTLALAGANTYVGGTAVTTGALSFRNIAAQPATSTTTVAAGATLGLGVGGAGFFSSADVDALWTNTLPNVTLSALSNVGLDTTAGDFTYGTNLATARGLTKLGANSLILAGNASSYSGLTTVSAGTLKLGAAGSGANSPLGTVTAGTVVNAGADLDLNGFSLATAEPLTLNGGALTNSSATAATYKGLLTLGSDSSLVANGGNLLVTAATLGGAGFTLKLDGSNSGSSLASAITGSGGVTKHGTGTWMLAGSSSFTGPTTIAAGTLKLGGPGSGANSPLGTLDAETTVTSGAALDLNGVSLATAEALTLNGSGISGGGALTNSSATALTYKGPILLASSSSIVTNNGSITLSNTVTGFGIGLTLDGSASSKVTGNLATTAGSLTKAGTGTWELAGTNTYSGLTFITAGSLKFAKPASLYNAVETSWTPANITVAGGATLRLAVGTASEFTAAQIGTLVSNLTAVNNNGLQNGAFLGLDTLTNVSGITTIAVNIPNSSGPGGGALGLKKFNGGTLLLTGANTYSGKTNIEVGSLKVATLNSVATNAGLGTVHTASSNLGAPVTVATGIIDFGVSGVATAAGLIYTGTGETTDRVMNIAAKNGIITFDQSGTGLLKFANPFMMTGGGNITIALQGATAGSGEIVGDLLNPAGFITTLTKAGTGTWTLSGANIYTGNTTVSAGTLVLADNAQLKFVIGATSGTTNTVSGAGAVVLNGDFAIDTTAAAALTSGSWTLVNAATLTESFTASFTVLGFIPNADGISWTKSESGKTWLFDESTGVLTLSSGGGDYDTWMAGYPAITSPADKLPTADPDRDGQTNRQEYAFGLNPSSAASVSPITVPLNKTTGIFTYTRRATPATTGLGYTIQTSTTMAAAGWTADVSAVQTVISTANNVQTVQVTLSAAKPLAAPKLFVRVLAQ